MHIRQALTTFGAVPTALPFWISNSAAQSATPTLTTPYRFKGPTSVPPDGWIPDAATWSETVLLDFSGGKNGFNPTAGVFVGKDGDL
jgi:hypothetical protein